MKRLSKLITILMLVSMLLAVMPLHAAAAESYNVTGVVGEYFKFVFFDDREDIVETSEYSGNVPGMKIVNPSDGQLAIEGTPTKAGTYVMKISVYTQRTDGYNIVLTVTIQDKPTGGTPVVTKDPTGESVVEGGSATFIAKATNVKQYVWQIGIADASIDAKDLPGYIGKGVKVSGWNTEKLVIENIPKELNGTHIWCRFVGAEESVTSSAAVLKVTALDDATPVITLQPQNYQYPEYAVAMYTVKASGSNLHCTWYLEYKGKTYNISDNTNGIEPWEGYAGEDYGGVQIDSNTFSWFFGGIEEELNGAEIWCVIEDGHYDAVSARAIITVQGDAMPPEITNMPAEITAYRGDSAQIRCLAKSTDGSQLEYTWYETTTGKLQDIRAIDPEETSDYMFASTESAGVRYYVCGITTSKGGRAYSSVVPVTVLDADPEYTPEMEILTKSLPDAVAGQPYKCQLECNDQYGLFTLYYNPGHPNQMEESGVHLTKENEILGTPQKAGKFTFTVCASGDYGEDYMEYTLTVREAPEPTDPTEPEGTIPEENPTEIEPSETESNETKPAKDEGKDKKDDKDDTIQDKNSKDEEDDEKDNENTQFPWWGIALIASASVGVGIGAAVLVMKKKS